MDLQGSIRERYDRLASEAEDDLSCGNTLALAGLKPGLAVADLGCGRGSETLAAARLVAPHGQAIGIDLSPAMVGQACRRREEAGLGNAFFLVADLTTLPLAAGSIDVVLSNCVLNHVLDKAAAYREIHRVLKPGGCFVIADVVSLAPLPPEVRQDPQAWAECYGGAIAEADYLAAISQAGFMPVAIRQRREYMKNGFPLASLTLRGTKPA
ncbi:MAG: methyltransferase domain-containing protein [Clostridia bacterium]|nr:MAG: methyltransferase domain-containing protein [Clostridia bacterium]